MGNAKSIRNNNYSVAMKKLIYISLCASLFFCSCEKSPVADNPGSTDNEIIIPSGEYIHFNTEALTRGTLINGGTLQDNFDVLGYKYSSSWDAAKVQVTPEVFKRKVGVKEYDHVETISYNRAGGYHDYSDPVEWTADKYAFFAYYPSSGTENVTIDASFSTYEGTPYVDYTLNVADITKHKDVMTACVKDTHKQASKQGVNLTMQHRLSALDFVGYSYVDAKAVNELNKDYPGWTNIPEDTPVEIIIDELTVTLENLAYNKVRISLDKSEDLDLQNQGTQAMIPSNTGGTTTYNFTYVSESLDTLMFPNRKTTILSRKLNGDKVNGCPMILIPQDTELKCTVDITYRIKAGDLISNVTYNPTKNVSDEINGLAEGVYNYFLLEFTKTGVHLRAEQSAQWDEKNVDHQFE